ncbi:MAG: L-seryl-tRNA(Sec) selenium transferase [Gemmatimonadetes bacterium]|nr:L-seryl-tRNA(Sec) selenium transferase [Gemmatimonadota bacterium]
MTDPRRRLPSVDALLATEPFQRLLASRPRMRVLHALRDALEDARGRLADGGGAGGAGGALPDAAGFAREVEARIADEERPSLRRVINATGVVLHTNLGRAPLPDAAVHAIAEIARGYSNLEYDLAQGARGSRYAHCTSLLCALTGAEAALIVNNNAAAVLLVMNELGEGREVIVSRGELVEIGGSFRVPEVIAKSGARLVEVGTTNRTHLSDYESAIGPDTAAILKVHQSNFRQVGFVADVGIAELAELGRKRGLPVVHDLGSGLLPDLTAYGLPPEPRPQESLAAGSDVVTFSGDKLLGGPQAGVILGTKALVEGMRRNPLLRALRVDKLTLAALHATLVLYLDPDRAFEDIPALRAIMANVQELRARAEAFAARLCSRVGARARATVEAARSQIGGGAYPGVELDTFVVSVRPVSCSEAELEARCRAADPPVVARVADGALLLDLRTVRADEEAGLCEIVSRALGA